MLATEHTKKPDGRVCLYSSSTLYSLARKYGSTSLKSHINNSGICIIHIWQECKFEIPTHWRLSCTEQDMFTIPWHLLALSAICLKVYIIILLSFFHSSWFYSVLYSRWFNCLHEDPTICMRHQSLRDCVYSLRSFRRFFTKHNLSRHFTGWVWHSTKHDTTNYSPVI